MRIKADMVPGLINTLRVTPHRLPARNYRSSVPSSAASGTVR